MSFCEPCPGRGNQPLDAITSRSCLPPVPRPRPVPLNGWGCPVRTATGVKSSVDASAAVVKSDRRKGASPLKMFAEMFSMAPGNKDHHVATRCAIGVFVPLITLVLLDRLDLAIFASFGAFTGIYGRNEPHAKRFGLQLR